MTSDTMGTVRGPSTPDSATPPSATTTPRPSPDDAGDACGVYVHVPFCRRRCSYCDFAFEVRPADRRFAAAVLAELSARQGELAGPPRTLSFGGGTPSALPVEDLARIVEGVRRTVGLADDHHPGGPEISLELNPEDVVAAGGRGSTLPRALADAGFTRASLGVQSFDDDVLRWLGRAHDGAGARAAVEACVAAGLKTGLDLIVGVPGERPDRLVRDVDLAVSLGVGHVSTYLLTVEAGTPLVKLIESKRRAPVDDDAQAAAYEDVQRLLPARGLTQYEVSSYARPGEESRHNRLYWGGGMYLGVGPSAHSMRRLEDGSVIRRHTTARLDDWLPDPAGAAHEDEMLSPRHAFLEAVAFGLRDLLVGVDVGALAARHRLAPKSSGNTPAHPITDRLSDPLTDPLTDPLIDAVVTALASLGDDVIRGPDGRFRLSARGARFADRAARAVLAADDHRG